MTHTSSNAILTSSSVRSSRTSRRKSANRLRMTIISIRQTPAHRQSRSHGACKSSTSTLRENHNGNLLDSIRGNPYHHHFGYRNYCLCVGRVAQMITLPFSTHHDYTCSDCVFHIFNHTDHRTYCRNPDSWEFNCFKLNIDSCDKYQKREPRKYFDGGMS